MPARKALYAILLCAFSAAAHAARIGEWTVFPAYKDATRNVVAGEWVYSLSSSNLYRYHAATGEVQFFSRQNGLNDAGISHIDYCRAEKCLVIVYENANIDLLYDNGDVTNIPQLRDSELADKAVNNLDVEGSQAYIALSGGVEVVDVAEAVLANYYAVGHTLSTTVFDGKLYASTTGGILCGRLTDNLLDSRNWAVADRTLTASDMVAFRGYVYAAGTGGGIYRIDKNNTRTLANGHLVNYLHSDGTTYMLAGNSSRVMPSISCASVAAASRYQPNCALSSDSCKTSGSFCASSASAGEIKPHSAISPRMRSRRSTAFSGARCGA